MECKRLMNGLKKNMIHVSTEQLDRAEEALRDGEIIVYPTETSYALGCDASNISAVERIFKIKGREKGKGLPILVSSIDSAKKIVNFSETALILAEKYWPGALNIIAPIKQNSKIAKLASQEDTQSVRISSHPFVISLLNRFSNPIIATSANISGKDAMYDSSLVDEIFVNSVDSPDMICDAGILPKREASTTIEVLGDKITIIRAGEIDIKI